MNQPQATPNDLRRLREEAGRARFAVLVVGYERETRFVWSGTGKPIAQLEALRRTGGGVVAVLGAGLVGNTFVYRLDPFPGHEDDPEMRAYLSALGEQLANTLEQRLEALLN